MDLSRTKFNGDLDELSALLDVFDALERVTGILLEPGGASISGPLRTELESVGTVARRTQIHRMAYRTTIALSYAGFERFICDLAEEAASTLARFVPRYSALTDGFRGHHLRLSLQAASHAATRETQSFRQEWLENLMSCLQDDQPYKVNAWVFGEHSANFRHELIRLTLRRLDVDVPVDVTSTVIEELLNGPLNGLYARAASVIDDLADRRNDVAHGGNVELLDRDTLRGILRFLRAYADALSLVVFDALAVLLVERAGNTVGTIEHTWTNSRTRLRSIAGFVPKAGQISRGHQVVVRGDVCRLATVASIQLNHVDVSNCGPSPDSFGVELGIGLHVGESICTLSPEALQVLSDLLDPG